MAKNFLSDDGFLHKRRPKTKTFTVPLERKKIEVDYYTDDELYKAKGDVLVHDLEIYPNYFLAAFKNWKTNKVVTFELFPGKPVMDYQKLLWIVHNFCIVGFNSIKFDSPILWLALNGASLTEIHDAVISIIKFNAMPRDIEHQYGFKQGWINHIDLIEVAPLTGSLKIYGGRLHAPRLQDLPYDPTENLTEAQAEDVKLYCINDLDLTSLLLTNLCPQLELRTAMSLQYGQDLRSKSDAQIAEAVITSEVSKLNGSWTRRPKIMPGTSYKYNVPDFIMYQSDHLKHMLEMVRNADFVIKQNGQVEMPKELNNFSVKIGNSIYRMGIGGLHSSEETVYHKATEDTLLIDRDVASYYPRIILNQQLFPKHLTTNFLDVYDSIVEKRLKAKSSGDKVTADSLKICVNGSFGKLGSKYSNLYAPDLMFQVTISGQLCLLMLIEMIECFKIPVVSGNTDGIIIKCPKNRHSELNHIIQMWENQTRFETEETRYKAVYSRDVNNYIAIKLKFDKVKKEWLDEIDGCKLKGAYSKTGLQKNPANTICVDAVIKLLTGNTSIEETILNCKDITKFVTVRNVKGGSEKNRVYLGKVVRWVYTKNSKGTINYVSSGNKVPKSDGAKPLMDLPNEFPSDINYQWYIDKTISILYDIGYLSKPTQMKFFN